MRVYRWLFALLWLALPLVALAKDDTPQWLLDAARQPTPAYAADAPAVVLLDAAMVSVEEGGKIVTTERYALRVLKREGMEDATGRVIYPTDTGKVRELRGWVVSGGDSRTLGKSSIYDRALGGESLYEDVRMRVVDGSHDCDERCVFGYESVLEEKSTFTNLDWSFQERLPVVDSRYTLELPAGWASKAVVLNHADLPSSVTGNSTTWELRDLPYLKDEPASPPVTSIAPRLAISLFPTPGVKTVLGQTFASWTDVSRYTTELHDPQSQPDSDITAKALTLTSGTHSDIDKIRAIGAYVQNLKYVSIQTGIGRGGGYRPHLASFTFAKNYGDCKDKANLMRAMLRAVGIASYPVLIFSGDSRYVHEEWPSPQQFNHCIIAVVLKDGVVLPAVLNHPVLGRLLIFDSTDSETPVGELPRNEQNSFALIAAAEKGVLLRMPEATADQNRVERTTELELAADGRVKGKQTELFYGQPAANARARFHFRDRDQYFKSMERWMAMRVPNVAVSSVNPVDDPRTHMFRLDIGFDATRFGQLTQQRLMIFRAATAPRFTFPYLTDTKRNFPVVLDPQKFTETITVKLPEGFDVDEIPEPGKISGNYGDFESTCAAKDGSLTCTRSLQVKAQIVAADHYREVRDFVEHVIGAEGAPVVLVKR